MSEPVLQTSGLTKRFGALLATDAVSIDLRAGEIHAIIGPNGAGKSTLIEQICGGVRPDAGRVLLMKKDISALGRHARARAGLGRTFQISALAMEDSVLENVVLGAIGAGAGPWHFWRSALASETLTDRARSALSRVGLMDRHDRICATLSHGQRRMLEVAVALTLLPRVFVMDEPMAGLGADGSKLMTAFLDDLRHEAPILLVEHDMDAVFTLADRISVMVHGKVIATGTSAEIRMNRLVREAYLGDLA
ncbi:MAG: ABC transporter ATP-binding protein [Rhodobacteraceae bacterium]|nr:ABC transporter ATP-binding protein [Paracoccaceae bacterium]